MALKLMVKFPDIRKEMAELGTSGAKAQTLAMGEVVEGWKGQIRGVVRQNFKRTPPHARARGLNFEKSFQGESFPSKRSRKASFNPAGFLVAKARFASVFEEGAGVDARSKKYLAIALPAAKKLGFDYGERHSGFSGRSYFGKQSQVERADQLYGPLRPIPAKGGDIILAASTAGGLSGGAIARVRKVGRGKARASVAKARGKRDFVPLFLLIKRVVLPKKISFVRIAEIWLNKLPRITERIVAELGR